MTRGRLALAAASVAAGWLIAAVQDPLFMLVLAMAFCARALVQWARATPSPHRGESDA